LLVVALFEQGVTMHIERQPLHTRFHKSAAYFAAVILLAAALIIRMSESSTGAIALSTGVISAKVSDHVGVDSIGNPDGTGTSNCVRYQPTSSATSSGWVTSTSSPNEAQTAHGQSGTSCPSSLDIGQQSAVGIRPAGATTFTSGTPFLLARAIHYNNPIRGAAQYWNGKFTVQLAGFDGSPQVGLNWWMWETPNNANPCAGGSDSNGCFDEIKFTSQIGDQIVTQAGYDYRLVVTGFVSVNSSTTCPGTPSGASVNDFWTHEGATTHACLYAALSQVRKVVISKSILGSGDGVDAPSAQFGFTTTGNISGSPWANGSFTLSPPTNGNASTTAKEIVSTDTISVTEAAPPNSNWSLTNIACTDYDANGNPRPLPSGATYNTTTRRLQLTQIPAPLDVSHPDITCVFQNTYTPHATLTLVKQVTGGNATLSDFTLTATGADVVPTADHTISGTSGLQNVTSRSVPAGAYTLSENGPSGYISNQGWSCPGASIVDNVVTLVDGANITCTITNRYQTGSLRINVVISAPPGSVTAPGRDFTGTYTCGTDPAAPFSATQASPFGAANLPMGTSCSVVAMQPTGDLANASFAWSTPTYSTQPVIIGDETESIITVTFPVIQRFGSFSVTKSISDQSGYTGAPGRIFPITYSCSIGDAVVASGTLNAIVGVPISPAEQIPATATCQLAETLVLLEGDFSDGSYEWSTPQFSDATVLIADDQNVRISVTNRFDRIFGSLLISKTLSGSAAGFIEGSKFTFTVSCGEVYSTTVTAGIDDPATTANIPRGTQCNVSEVAPTGGLSSTEYSWGTTPSPQSVTVERLNQSVVFNNSITFVASTTTSTTLPATTTTTVPGTTTTIPGTTTTIAPTTTTIAPTTTTTIPTELDVLVPDELQELPVTGHSSNSALFTGILMILIGGIFVLRKRIIR
jgi:LPXTG-motif cell wall-anchored protein